MRGEDSGVKERDADAAMDRYAEGDAAAFAVVYDAIAPLLLGFLLRLARPQAEDLVQHQLARAPALNPPSPTD